MTDEAIKDQLVEQFRAYLETSEVAPEIASSIDLFSLFTELAAIRNEVKLEARQFKTALDQFKTTFDFIQENQKSLVEETKRRYRHQQQETLRSFLMDCLEIYDRLEAAVNILNNYKSFFWIRFCSHEARILKGLQEGHAMTLRRFMHMLNKHQVYPIEVLHQTFNPHFMQAIESDFQAHLEAGLVTGELRKGFRWGNEILRLAEVKVNKKN